MIIDAPSPTQIPLLRKLWKQAFGDEDVFLDAFFTVGFHPTRCRCITDGGKVLAALYWFDCSWNDKKLAYLYAVATEAAMQDKGLCRALMEDTHRHLAALGYAGTLLVPGSKDLFRLYEKLGYHSFSGIRQWVCGPAAVPAMLKKLTPAEYAGQRRRYLPAGSVLQEGALLDFLATQADFYAMEQGLLCAAKGNNSLFVYELLGDPDLAPGIVAAFGAPEGTFRTPGHMPFAMYRSLTGSQDPSYFAFALD